MSTLPLSRRGGALLAASIAAVLVSGCSGGSGGGGGAFQVTASNLPNGFAGWEINRAVRVTFNQAIDPTSVNNNSVQVRLVGGAPGFGTPGVDPADPNTVVWRPLCPTEDDLSDAGLLSGIDPSTGAAYQYELNIIGADKNAGFTIRSTAGRALELSHSRLFTTPVSQQFSELFVDDVVGPPVPVIRDEGSAEQAASHVLVGGVRHFFERPASGGSVALNPPLDLPLNLLSNPNAHVELYVQVNQSVDMRSTNINSARMRWEFEASPGVWQPLVTEVELESNCTETGAVVRVVPSGLLPPSSLTADVLTRAVLTTDFRDIIGERNSLPQDNFAKAMTDVGPSPLADHFLEEFVSPENHDAGAPFAEPAADWGPDSLSAKFSFTGTGGPGGDFDWKVGAGQTVIFNTVSTILVGGPGYTTQTTQFAKDGLIDVRNLWIEAGGVVRCQGPNPVRIMASGDIRIEGLLDLSGTNSPGVSSLNTTLVPEPGAPGQCGGGKGGTGSRFTSVSTPDGGNGYGAFDALDGGGSGGETGWSYKTANVDLRRGAGGGGGRLGEEVPDRLVGQPGGPIEGTFDQTRIGLDGEPGFDNSLADNGAKSGPGPAYGGAVGPRPFLDGDPTNDFYGSMFDAASSQVVLGELKAPWAGAGGGGGGDAAKLAQGATFPGKFIKKGDEKGAGGGGGGGSLEILALGKIVVSGSGKIKSRGGTGGGGENTIYLDRVGGGSGGGSGGHIVLQSATAIDFSGMLPNGASTSFGVVASGAQGGAGADDKGGATAESGGMQETSYANDACPKFQRARASLPVGVTSGKPCKGRIDGAGGDGGPGIIQLHTSTGVIGQDILLPAGLTLGDVCSPPPICYDGAGTCYLIPTFGRTSRARSVWIALGEGGFDATATPPSYRGAIFEFQGVDTATGLVQTDGFGNVMPTPALLTATSVLANGYTFTMDASSLVGGPNEYYLENTELLRHFLLELQSQGTPTDFMRFDVVDASYDPGTQQLALTLDANGPSLGSFTPGTAIDALFQPAFFRVRTNGVDDSLPDTASVKIQFEATVLDASGAPQESPVAVPLTSNVGDLNSYLGTSGDNSELRFVRFEVLFDIDALQQGLTPTNPVPATSHLRIPFRYP